MNATLTGSVLTALPRPQKVGSKAYVDLYLLQDGERAPVVAYAEAVDLPVLPTPGEVVTADVSVWASTYAGGGLSVRVTGLRSAA